MTAEILNAKLEALQQVLRDLKPHLTQSRSQQQQAHYEIERQIQLCVDLCLDLSRRWFSQKRLPIPQRNREVFQEFGTRGAIPPELGQKLALAAGLRNLIVHEYGVIDYEIFFSGLASGFDSFSQLVEHAAKWETE